MAATEPFVIVGGGLAGAKAAETLRGQGYDGPLVLVAAEPENPYERPPLSKGYLLGKDPREKARVHDAGWYATTTSTCGPASGRLASMPPGTGSTLDTGEELPYAKLLLATGSSPRRLPVPGAELGGVRYLRTSSIPTGCSPTSPAAGGTW